MSVNLWVWVKCYNKLISSCLHAGKEICPDDGWPGCPQPHQKLRLLQALVGCGHKGTANLTNSALSLRKTCVLMMAVTGSCDFYWIRKSYCMVEIYEVVIGWCIFFKCIFIISWSHLACPMFTSALRPMVKLKNYVWFLSLTWLRKRCQVWKC